jgi:hypothetical protein
LPNLKDLKLEEDMEDSDDELPKMIVNNTHPEMISKRSINNNIKTQDQSKIN